ncbi:MAG: OmpA family protein [Gemmatimonadota bacterium]|nr:OmpA family protein [Gemmatimonadota bacterium]
MSPNPSASTQSRQVRRVTAFRRLAEPIWPFAFRGLLPVLGLILVALFGVTRFASAWIEDSVRSSVSAALADAGATWAELEVSGQHVTISGSVPTAAAAEVALNAARTATCPTWVGELVCATIVRDDFLTPPRDAPDAEVEAGVSPAVDQREAAERCEERLAEVMSGTQIQFTSGSASIAASSSDLLDRIAAIAAECPGRIRIEGHTDSTGNPEANMALSAQRAEAVRRALGERGVSTDRLEAVGFGQTSPIATNGTPAGRALNRRIEFHLPISGN